MSASPPQSKKCWRWYHPVLLLAIIILVFVLQLTWLKANRPLTPEEESRAGKELNIGVRPKGEQGPPTKTTENQGGGEQSVTPSKPTGNPAGGEPAVTPPKPAANPVVGEQTAPAAQPATKPKTNAAYPTTGIRWVWCGEMALLLAFVLVAGHGITGLWRGAFIDSRNKISLSRFQMLLWTILIVSAYLTAVLININRGQPDPTAIALDATLWMLMGISTTSLVGSPLIKSTKKETPAGGSPPEADREFELLSKQGIDPNRVDIEGQLIVNKSPEDASWGDLFRGEDVTNAGHLDLAKIQMFYFTIIVVLAYGVGLGEMFRTTIYGIESFPSLSSGIVALLGISHGGYLASKAVTRSPS